MERSIKRVGRENTKQKCVTNTENNVKAEVCVMFDSHTSFCDFIPFTEILHAKFYLIRILVVCVVATEEKADLLLLCMLKCFWMTYSGWQLDDLLQCLRLFIIKYFWAAPVLTCLLECVKSVGIFLTFSALCFSDMDCPMCSTCGDPKCNEGEPHLVCGEHRKT